ncbi:MAG: hypothetical protein WC222_10905 [Parachlamydiales bacterium]|jgi:hypothetical protein
MSFNDYTLNPEDYTWSNALLWGNCLGHYQKCWTGNLDGRIVHAILTALEIIPGIGQIISIAEKILYSLFLSESASTYDPLTTSRKSQLINAHKGWQRDLQKDTSTETFNQIQVLDQNIRSGGYEECGFHALKNALVGVAVAHKMGGISADDFNNPDFYDSFHVFVKSYKENWNEGDASIAVLNTALMELSKKDPSELDETKKTIATLYSQNTISLFNLSDDRLVGGQDHTTLDFAANLFNVFKQQGPFTHGFVIGYNGHWYTLILERDNSKRYHWSGCDSNNPNSKNLYFLKNFLEKIILNPYSAEQTTFDIYWKAIGEWILKKSSWLDEKGAFSLKEDKKSLLNKASRDDYVLRIVNTFYFMKRVGWIKQNNPSNIKSPLKCLLKLALCFEIHSKNSSEKAQLKNICEELQKCFQSLMDPVIKDKMLANLPQFISNQEFAKTYARPHLDQLKPNEVNLPIPLSSPPKEITHYSKAIYHAYNAEGINDYEWGCAWRAIQTCLSAYKIKRSLKELFHLFGTLENLTQIYKNKYPQKNLPQTKVFAPFDLSNGWAEPFIGHLIMHFYGIESELLFINALPRCYTPKEVFPKEGLLFSAFKEMLASHFAKTNPAPMMIDDGKFTFNIVGVGFENEDTLLWVADPHIKEGVNTVENLSSPVGLYTVRLNHLGEQTYSSLDAEDKHKIPSLYLPSIYYGIAFKSKPWMLLVPGKNNS